MKTDIIELICESFSTGIIEEDTADTYTEFVRSADLDDMEDVELLEEMVNSLMESKVNHTPERHAARDFAMRGRNLAAINKDERIVDDSRQIFKPDPNSKNKSPYKRYKDLLPTRDGAVGRARELRDRANKDFMDSRLAAERKARKDKANAIKDDTLKDKEKTAAELRAKLLNNQLKSGKGTRFATNPRASIGDYDYGRNGGYSRDWDTAINIKGKRYKE